jgi:hypothetical protein
VSIVDVLAAVVTAIGRSGSFAVIGAVARNAWAPPRATTDLEVLRRAVDVDVGGLHVPIASPEDIVVYKLLADRPRDREDIRAVLRTQARAGRPFDWDHVERWAAFWRIADRLRALRLDV